VPAPGDYDDGEIGGVMIGRGNRSTQRKSAPVPLCPPQIPHTCPDANPGGRGGKPATNRLTYGMVCYETHKYVMLKEKDILMVKKMINLVVTAFRKLSDALSVSVVSHHMALD
jgi:hypothetical protein